MCTNIPHLVPLVYKHNHWGKVWYSDMNQGKCWMSMCYLKTKNVYWIIIIINKGIVFFRIFIIIFQGGIIEYTIQYTDLKAASIQWSPIPGKMPCIPMVIHAQVNCEMRKVQHLWMQKCRTILYGQLLLGWLLQPGSFPHLYNQGGISGLYWTKVHKQCDINYCGIHQGHPGPLLGRISPIQAVILTPYPNQKCCWYHHTFCIQHRSSGPSAHLVCCRWKRHANGHKEQQKNSNCERPTEGPATTPILTADPDRDTTSASRSGESDGDSDYI